MGLDSIGLAAVLTAALAGAAPSWTPGARSQAELGRGRAVSHVTAEPGGAGLVRAAIDIGAPAQVVWRVMTDCRETSRLIAGASCRVLAADPAGAWDVREQVTRGGLMFPALHNIYRGLTTGRSAPSASTRWAATLSRSRARGG